MQPAPAQGRQQSIDSGNHRRRQRRTLQPASLVSVPCQRPSPADRETTEPALAAIASKAAKAGSRANAVVVAAWASGTSSQALLTEWEEIVDRDWADIAGIMGMPRYVFEGRNALNAESMADLGFDHAGIDRGYPDRLAKETDDLARQSATCSGLRNGSWLAIDSGTD